MDANVDINVDASVEVKLM